MGIDNILLITFLCYGVKKDFLLKCRWKVVAFVIVRIHENDDVLS